MQPEVIIHVKKKGKKRENSPVSDIATQGSTVVNMVDEQSGEDKDKGEEYRSDDMIEKMERWAENGRVEIDLIETYLQRGYEWPLANTVKPKRKSQRRQLKEWIEKNKEMINEKKSKKKGIQYGTKDNDFHPSDMQMMEWQKLLKELDPKRYDHQEARKVEIRTRGLIKHVLRGGDVHSVQEYIPKDHWVYIQLKEWLRKEAPNSDRQAELRMDDIYYQCGVKVSESLYDTMMEHDLMPADQGLKKRPSSPKSMEDQPSAPKKGKESESSQIRVTECQSSPTAATKNPPSLLGVTNSQPSLTVTDSHPPPDDCPTIMVNAIMPTRPPGRHESTTHPYNFHRAQHRLVTLDEELETGQYPCQEEVAIKHHIDWPTFLKNTNRHDWMHTITQEIMEGRHTALDEWQLESWAKSVDPYMGNILEDEDTGEWYMTDRQYERMLHHIRSAEEWFQNHTLRARLKLLNPHAWLTQAVRLYTQGRGKWPRMMGAPPTTNAECRLLELWEKEVKRIAPMLPTAIDDYDEWWKQQNLVHYEAYTINEAKQLRKDAVNLAKELWNLAQAARKKGTCTDL